ncbi:cupin domain-containing protein [Jannaschia pohangensis]|nr:cupin domain-containing protein [Jannaschia pohangensis]
MTPSAETILPAPDFGAELAFWTKRGFRLDAIWPADDPEVARLSGMGLRLRLERAAEGPVTLRLEGDGTKEVSPAGNAVIFGPGVPSGAMPKVQQGFGLRRLAEGAPWIIGRAGMQYRDLVPDRLGGAIIASHIRIPDGGPVPDMVHFHTIGFQLIHCYKGWVDLVYEDQGPPFRLIAGSCVIQPPEIRHRVLFASDNIEVIEIGVPAVHVTTIDHEMELPNDTVNPERRFQGQTFVHHRPEEATWGPAAQAGFTCRDTTIAAHTGDVAGVRVLRPDSRPTAAFRHDAEIHFTFVLSGEMTLTVGGATHAVATADAFVTPPGEDVIYEACSDDLELLEVTLPGSPTLSAP